MLATKIVIMARPFEHLVKKALEEREELGIYVPDIDIEVGIYQTPQFATGYIMKEGKNLLLINPTQGGDEEENLEAVRREIERISILEAKLNETFLELNERERELQEEVVVRGNRDREMELAEVKIKKIRGYLENFPINECCFLVFCFIPYKRWDMLREDPEGLKENIVQAFDFGIWRYDERIAEALLIDGYVHGRLDERTCEYVRDTILVGRRPRRDEGVDLEAAEDIFAQIAEYKRIASENARQAADAIVTAYAENPTRLKKAYERARNFDEFIGCLFDDNFRL
ncbi:MAG: hypothetical protein OD814_001685 [Candidatus Alkanophagales archaeon MCA70_species_1]|nr:hypothetical protein [Candidatus Alkanophaga volatiphilum]